MKRTLTALIAALIALCPFLAGASGRWTPDILGNGYEARTVEQGAAADGRVVSTIIRRLLPDTLPCGQPRRAVLYVHGFNDYFFNPELGRECNRAGYDFYAVDLRRYGRSILPGQRMFDVRNLTEYFPDIDSALVEMRHSGVMETVLMGHSTGGLITALFCSKNPAAPVDLLVLNSPFLDWNLGWQEHLVPLVAMWGAAFPSTPVPQGESTAYAESLLASHHGEWDYRTDWKLERSPDVTAGWVRAIDMAQHELRDGKARIQIPILLMYSSASVNTPVWDPVHNRADGVLDVNDIRRYGMELGPRVTPMKVVGGLHDLLLSRPALRQALYKRIFEWCAAEMPPLTLTADSTATH